MIEVLVCIKLVLVLVCGIVVCIVWFGWFRCGFDCWLMFVCVLVGYGKIMLLVEWCYVLVVLDVKVVWVSFD